MLTVAQAVLPTATAPHSIALVVSEYFLGIPIMGYSNSQAGSIIPNKEQPVFFTAQVGVLGPFEH